MSLDDKEFKEIMDEQARVSLDDKVEKYFYYLINYGHETASMWVQGNVKSEELEEFRVKMGKAFGRHGFKR